MQDQQLIVFVKTPRVGSVKTRLAQALGAGAACAAYCRLVETLLKRLARIPHLELRFSPDDAASEIQPWCRAGWQTAPQGRGDLGQRLHRAFCETFAAGASKVVIIGSDCPDVTPGDIEAAWAALGENDLVLGPATDGGYWLIGLRMPRPRLFEAMPWSTSDVLLETRARAQASGLRVHLLRELADIDTEADWRSFLRRE